jgi:RNA polymerase sigma-70 factor (ECF subfamily)
LYPLRVKGLPGTLQSGGAVFATTHWSVVAACQAESPAQETEVEAAIARLCSDYWPAIYSFVRRRGYAPADAQDLVQGFFSHFLQKRIYLQADSRRGKFRTFLLAALKSYLADSWRKERAAKRGGPALFLTHQLDEAEKLYTEEMPNPVLSEEQLYEQRWAANLVARALRDLEEDFRVAAKASLFAELKPFVCGGVDLPRHEEIAQRLGMPIDTLRSHLARLRARFREVLREEVARTIGAADDVDEELRHLSRILIAAA